MLAAEQVIDKAIARREIASLKREYRQLVFIQIMCGFTIGALLALSILFAVFHVMIAVGAIVLRIPAYEHVKLSIIYLIASTISCLIFYLLEKGARTDLLQLRESYMIYSWRHPIFCRRADNTRYYVASPDGSRDYRHLYAIALCPSGRSVSTYRI